LEVQGYTFGRLYAGAIQGSATPGILAQNTYEARDTVIQTIGAHTIPYGALIRWEQDNDNLSGQSRPDYVFQGMWNYANDAPVFESVAANPNTGGFATGQRYFRDHNIAAFVQHDWKVTPNLTLNTGLHWEYFPGGGKKYFQIGTPGSPGIGRNSWNGPCYLDTDLSAARVQAFNVFGHETSVRFQANFYNAFNKTNLAPLRHTERNRGKLPLRPLSGGRRWTRDRLLRPS
jgi:hypothetical protein